YLHPGGPETGPGADRPVHGQRAHPPRRPGRGRARRVRWTQRSVHLDPHARLRIVVGLLRPVAGRGAGGGCARIALRAEWGGLLRVPRFGLSRRQPRAAGAHRGGAPRIAPGSGTFRERRRTMKFGLRYASLGRYSNGPAAVELAQAAEAAGFDSIWTVEHV